MTENTSEKAICPFGAETLRASIKGGYANLTVGLVALHEKGYKPGYLFSGKDLLASGLKEDIVKTIINQCQGKEYDKRMGPKERTEKKNAKWCSPKDHQELKNIIQDLRACSPLPSQNLPLIAGRDSIKNLFSRQKPPESSAVKALFSITNKSETLDQSAKKTDRGPGRPPRLFVLPSPDEYAQLFNVATPDAYQVHYPISGHKTTRTFRDAFHRAWMETNQNDESNKHDLGELGNIQGDSAKTIRDRNQRTDIEAKSNIFRHPVTEKEKDGLLLSCRGGCWFELELPSRVFPLMASFNLVLRDAPKYRVDKAGLAKAVKEWEDAGSPGKFMDCLRICGKEWNSYIIHGEQVYSGFTPKTDPPMPFTFMQSELSGFVN